VGINTTIGITAKLQQQSSKLECEQQSTWKQTLEEMHRAVFAAAQPSRTEKQHGSNTFDAVVQLRRRRQQRSTAAIADGRALIVWLC
jgi:hypothetical protein